MYTNVSRNWLRVVETVRANSAEPLGHPSLSPLGRPRTLEALEDSSCGLVPRDLKPGASDKDPGVRD